MTTTLTMQGIRALTRGDEEGALEAFGMALDGSGDFFEARLCRARLLVMRRRYEEAEAALAALAEEAPDCAEARLLLGISQRERYRLYDAVESFRAAALLDPRDGRAEAALRELLDVQEP